MKDNNASEISEFIGELNTLIAFISFVIIYCNILISTGAVYVIQVWSADFPGPLKLIIYSALGSPAVIGVWVVWEFAREIVKGSLLAIRDEGNPGFFGLFYFSGAMIGVFTFVLTLSAFVAFQSNSYLQEIAPDVQNALEKILMGTTKR